MGLGRKEHTNLIARTNSTTGDDDAHYTGLAD